MAACRLCCGVARETSSSRSAEAERHTTQTKVRTSLIHTFSSFRSRTPSQGRFSSTSFHPVGVVREDERFSSVFFILRSDG